MNDKKFITALCRVLTELEAVAHDKAYYRLSDECSALLRWLKAEMHEENESCLTVLVLNRQETKILQEVMSRIGVWRGMCPQDNEVFTTLQGRIWQLTTKQP